MAQVRDRTGLHPDMVLAVRPDVQGLLAGIGSPCCLPAALVVQHCPVPQPVEAGA